MVTRFPVAKMSKAQLGRIEKWTQSWRFLLLIANQLSFAARIIMNHSNSILAHFIGWVFHALQTLAN